MASIDERSIPLPENAIAYRKWVWIPRAEIRACILGNAAVAVWGAFSFTIPSARSGALTGDHLVVTLAVYPTLLLLIGFQYLAIHRLN
jgi:hypothetical protein